MKCPKCGFVSFPGLARCKQCGHQFVDVAKTSNEAPSLFQQPQEKSPIEDVLIASRVDVQSDLAGTADEQNEPLTAAEDLFVDEPGLNLNEASDEPIDSANEPAWQEELSRRLGDFRRRRGTSGKAERRRRSANLDLDFGSAAAFETRRKLIEFPSHEAEEDAQPEPQVQRKTSSTTPFLGNILAGLGVKNSSSQDANIERSGGGVPMEIELKPPKTGSILLVEEETSAPTAAPMGRRFLAGMIDALVLLLAAGLFALIFRQAGGSLSRSPLDLAAVAFMAASIIVLYFGASTAFASATPGSIWTGLEVRTFEGNSPRTSDCLWRAFGYLISMSALMLGFVWALVDGDGLTWHDRMSGTSLVPAASHEKVQPHEQM